MRSRLWRKLQNLSPNYATTERICQFVGRFRRERKTNQRRNDTRRSRESRQTYFSVCTRQVYGVNGNQNDETTTLSRKYSRFYRRFVDCKPVTFTPKSVVKCANFAENYETDRRITRLPDGSSDSYLDFSANGKRIDEKTIRAGRANLVERIF